MSQVNKYLRNLSLPGGIQPAAIVGIPIIGIMVSETLLFYDQISLSLLGHITVIIYCTLGIRVFQDGREILGGLVLISIFRLVNLATPVITTSTLLWLPAIYGPFLPGLLWYVRSNRTYSVRWIGRPLKFVLYIPIVVGLTVILAPIEYFILQPESLIPLWVPRNVLVLSVIMVFFVSLVEEIIFRGILQGALVNRYGVMSGILVMSLLFGVSHAGFASTNEIGFAIAVGIIFGTIYHVTDSLFLPVLSHGLLNVLVFGLFPLQGALVTFGP